MSTPLANIIIHEDEDLLVLNKPANLVTTRTQTVSEPTLQDYVAEYLEKIPEAKAKWQELIPADFSEEFGSPESIFAARSGLGHRLDKDTSGVLVVAKNPGALVNILAQFKQRKTHKEYICLVHGKFAVPSGDISAAVVRDPVKRHQFAVRPEGKPAHTEYRVEHFYPHLDASQVVSQIPKDLKISGSFTRQVKHYQGFSLVHCWPKTGRTHQIRVHMAFIKHPLVGDQTYVGKKRAKLDAVWCPRQFLHAHALTMQHPRSREKVTFTAPLAPDLQQVLELLHE